MIDPILKAFFERFDLPNPQPEFRFHKTRKWRFDYAWAEHKIALEVEGGIYAKGRRGGHTSISGMLRDIEKYNEATLLGWRVFRVTPDKLLTVKTAEIIKAAMGPYS